MAMHPCISTKTKTRILYSRGMLDGSSTLGKDEHVHKSSFHGDREEPPEETPRANCGLKYK